MTRENMPVAIDRIDIQMLKGGKFRFISDPEGTLVRYQDHAERVEALSLEVARLNRVKFALTEKAAAHADNCAVYRAQLAEQPAPVVAVSDLMQAVHGVAGFPGVTGDQLRDLADRLNGAPKK